MKRIAALLLLALLPLSAAAYPLDRYAFEVPPVEPVVVQPQPTLVERYAVTLASGTANHNLTAYRPRQVATGLTLSDPSWGTRTVANASAFAGWDLLPGINEGSNRVAANTDYLTIRLTRSATVGVFWRAGGTKPSWLDATWTQAGAMTEGNVFGANRTALVYAKVFPAGDVVLGGVNQGVGGAARDVYWVVLAEADGTPSEPPPAPDNQELTVSNSTCPDWLHGIWTATGPDGQTYPTWHPAIDPVYWCYYRHDHGADPDGFGVDPVFGYAAPAENHAGFKVYRWTANGHEWLLVHHMGTSGAGRACNRHHTADLAVKRLSDGAIVYDVHGMADHGRSENVDTHVPFTPSACPTQAQDAAGSGGVRQISVAGGTNYEPWRFVPGHLLGQTGTITVNTRDQITKCADMMCNAVVVNGAASGTERFLTFSTFALADPGASVRGADGRYCTDAMAHALVPCGTAGAIEQYVEPGLSLGQPASVECVDRIGWGTPQECVGVNNGSISTERENSIPTGGPN